MQSMYAVLACEDTGAQSYLHLTVRDALNSEYYVVAGLGPAVLRSSTWHNTQI